VVVHREALRLRIGRLREALRAGQVEVATAGRADVAGDAVPAPAEVVRRRDVGEEVEPLDVPEVRAGFDQAGRIDDERRLVVRLAGLDEAGNALVSQDATPRIS
jgi:hypothetical protein